MAFKIIAPGHDPLEITNALPPGFNGKLLPITTATFARSSFGQLCFQHYTCEGFDIWFKNYQICRTTTLIGCIDIPVLQLLIHLLNPSEIRVDSANSSVVMPYQYNLSYTPISESKFESDKTYERFRVHFKIPYLKKLAADFPILDEFLSMVEKGQPADISKFDRFLSPSMIQVVNSILNCRYKNVAARFFIEAKVLELLLLALYECSEENQLDEIRLTAFDKEMLYLIKAYVENQFSDTFTLKDLSKRFAINEYKLKKGFKLLFGTTVFEYVNSVRMNKAHLLVEETELTINEIAELTGFNDRASFDKAFKKHFSYTAAFVRRNKPISASKFPSPLDNSDHSKPCEAPKALS